MFKDHLLNQIIEILQSSHLVISMLFIFITDFFLGWAHQSTSILRNKLAEIANHLLHFHLPPGLKATSFLVLEIWPSIPTSVEKHRHIFYHLLYLGINCLFFQNFINSYIVKILNKFKLILYFKFELLEGQLGWRGLGFRDYWVIIFNYFLV